MMAAIQIKGEIRSVWQCLGETPQSSQGCPMGRGRWDSPDHAVVWTAGEERNQSSFSPPLRQPRAAEQRRSRATAPLGPSR